MPPKRTKKPLRNTALADCTERTSPESASSGRQLKGLRSEDLVLEYFLKRQFDLLARRKRIIGVEVDLLFKKSACLHIVEVKSYREGFPNVVMQSGAMGLYSIVSDINGCNEIIHENVNGTIIPTKDPEAIYRAMKYILAHQERLLGNRSTYRKLIQDRYERSFIWNELLKEYEELEARTYN